MNSTEFLDDIKCEICLDRSFDWAIKPPIWHSDRCWNHMSRSERVAWKDELIRFLNCNNNLRSKREEDRSFKAYLNKYMEWYRKKYNYPENPSESELREIRTSLHKDFMKLKEKNPIRINLHGVDLSDLDLSGFNLDYTVLDEAEMEDGTLIETSLRYCSICRSNLSRCKMQKAILSDSIIENSYLTECNLEEVIAVGVKFNKTILFGSSFMGARLQYCSFIDADIRECIFQGTQLLGANFGKSKARNANFTEASLESVLMRNAMLMNTQFRQANLSKSDLTDTDMTNADLSEADLEKAVVNNTIFTDADLRGANIRNVDIYLAKLGHTKVYYEDIQLANVLTDQLKDDSFLIERRQKTRVFISYSHSDAQFAQKLKDALEDRSIDVWIDSKEIFPGESLIRRIREGIDTSQFVCALISKSSVQSEWVQNELDVAMNHSIEGKRIIVIPLVLEEKVEMPSFLLGRLYVDFSQDEYFNTGIDQIMRTLNKYII